MSEPRKTPGRPFTNGDGRINRKGRPRSFDQFRALAQKIAGEKLVTPGGSALTVAEAILRSWAKSKEPQLQRAFIEFAAGRYPTNSRPTNCNPNPFDFALRA